MPMLKNQPDPDKKFDYVTALWGEDKLKYLKVVFNGGIPSIRVKVGYTTYTYQVHHPDAFEGAYIRAWLRMLQLLRMEASIHTEVIRAAGRIRLSTEYIQQYTRWLELMESFPMAT